MDKRLPKQQQRSSLEAQSMRDRLRDKYQSMSQQIESVVVNMVRNARPGAGLRPTRRITSRISSNSCSRHSPDVMGAVRGVGFIFKNR